MERKGSLDDRPLKRELLTDKYHPQPVISDCIKTSIAI